MQIVSIGGVELAYRTAGDEGDRPALLIHGYTGNLRNWALTVPALLQSGYCTLSADSPGHGDAAAPGEFEHYALPQVAEVLHQLAEGLDQVPSVVIGHSMGAAVAEEYALAHPADVRALVLIGSAGGSSGPEREDLSDDMEALREVYEHGGMAAVFDYQLAHGKRPGVEHLDTDQLALLRSEFALTSFEGFEYGSLALRVRHDTLPRLADLKCPTLVVRGEHEAPTLMKVSDDLAATIPGARYEVVAGAAHSPHLEQPEAFNAVLQDFLAHLDR